MKKIKSGNRLTKNQETCQKELKKEIKNIKSKAKIASRGIPHKQIKIATAKLVELYKQPRFKDNHNFLLRRYSDLEKRNEIWYNVFIPFIVSVITTLVLEDKIRQFVECEIFALFERLKEIFPTIPPTDTLLNVMYWGCYVLIVVFACLVYVSLRKIFKSFERSPEVTIKENEMKIIKELLWEHKIFIKD